MNKYQEALNRIKSIDLDLVQEEMGEKCLYVSIYGIHDYPTLEMSGDIDTLQELIDKSKPLTPASSIYNEKAKFCPKCTYQLEKDDNYCRKCGQQIDWSERK